MDSINIKIPVTVKAKLTDKLKNRIVGELNEAVKRAEMELSQIDIEERRALAEQGQNDLQRMNAIRQHFGVERGKRQDFIADAKRRLAETNRLAQGAEIVQGQLERITELKVGDNIRELMNLEILVEDDKVIAFRN